MLNTVVLWRKYWIFCCHGVPYLFMFSSAQYTSSIYPFLIIQCFCDWHDENKLSFFFLRISIFTSHSSHTNFYMFISRHRVAMDWNSISTIATPHHKLSTERRVQDLCAYNVDWTIPTAVEWAAKQWRKKHSFNFRYRNLRPTLKVGVKHRRFWGRPFQQHCARLLILSNVLFQFMLIVVVLILVTAIIIHTRCLMVVLRTRNV